MVHGIAGLKIKVVLCCKQVKNLMILNKKLNSQIQPTLLLCPNPSSPKNLLFPSKSKLARPITGVLVAKVPLSLSATGPTRVAIFPQLPTQLKRMGLFISAGASTAATAPSATDPTRGSKEFSF
jgi:hypothetical protein